jgi:ethanolamine ammonia-lyase small subunit
MVRGLSRKSPSPDIALVIADGLSSFAIERHAGPFLRFLVPELENRKYSLSTHCLVEQGRVAVGDHVGELLAARMTVILIGERPGLSSPDSMGIYFTYRPRRGVTDAQRNCISNIHGNGLAYEKALEKLLFLILEADRLKLSGVQLKEEAGRPVELKTKKGPGNFLTG